MEHLFTQLTSLLGREADLYGSLLDALADESRRLVTNDLEGLIEATRRKDTIALQIRSLEESRFLLLDKFSRALGRGSEELTVGELLPLARGVQAVDLGRERERLKEAVKQTNSLNERNRRLVENSLRLLQGTFENIQTQIRTHLGAPKGYGPARPQPSKPQGGVVVSRQA